MCGRYASTLSAEDLGRYFHADEIADVELRPSWNIPPTSAVPIVLEKRDDRARFITTARWSLVPPFADSLTLKYPTFNARSETVTEKPTFRGSVAHQRAILPADAYFELHIEQGPILEKEGQTIGVVTGAQAQVWWDARIIGQDSHAGTTPPYARRDALVTAARVIDLVDRRMRERGDDGRGTVGFLKVLPNSRNVIPGEVAFSVEFRHPDTAQIEHLAMTFPAEALALVAETGCTLELTELFRFAAQPFDADCVGLVQQAADRLGYPSRRIVSGAGHDAVYVARCVPAAMIFTPCKDGLSHNEAESIEPTEAEAGCQVLFEAVVARANRSI
jgi:N-carbamoyl-L-amino-acid hydrolase